MGIHVATKTFRTQAQVRFVEVLDFDFCARASGNVRGVVTLRASQLGMLPLQGESGESSMLKRLAVQSGEQKLLPIVFHMAAGAIGLCVGSFIRARMIARVLTEAATDLGVALQAFETA